MFLDEKLKGLIPYVPGEQPADMDRLIKLNTNESPFPPSPKVLEAITAGEIGRLRLYPDPECRGLVSSIARFHGVGTENVFPGNGSDEVLGLCFHGMCGNGAAFADITYGFYKVYAAMFGVRADVVPLRGDFSIAVSDYEGLPGTVFIANPNAPTGICLPPGSIRELLEQDKSRLVVVDEAYVEFGGESVLPLLPEYDNLLIVRTFSKSHSLAGARLGYAVGRKEEIEALNTLKFSFNPYNVNRLSLLAGAAAMDDREYFEKCRDEVIAAREYTAGELRRMDFEVTDSKANFIFAGGNAGISGREYFTALRENGILVRHFSSPRIENYVRITVGDRDQMKRLIAATEKILAERGGRS